MENKIFYWKGDKAKYTGKSFTKYGGKWFEFILLEGHLKGQKKVTNKPPKGANEMKKFTSCKRCNGFGVVSAFIPPAWYNDYKGEKTTHLCDLCDGYTFIRFSQVKKWIKAIKNPLFLYARQRRYGTQLYEKNDDSPTGVINFYSIPNEYSDQIIRKYRKTSALSPTEGLRSAR